MGEKEGSGKKRLGPACSVEKPPSPAAQKLIDRGAAHWEDAALCCVNWAAVLNSTAIEFPAPVH